MGNGSDLAREHVGAQMKVLGPSGWESLGESLQALSGPQSSQLEKRELEVRFQLKPSTTGKQSGLLKARVF